MRHRVPRPRRSLAAVVGSVVTLLGWAAVAHNSGSGWMQALGAILAAFLLVALAGPSVVVSRARCTVVSSPLAATAGQPCAVEVAVTTPVELRPVSPPGEVALSGRRSSVEVTLVPPRRGVVTSCVLDVSSAAPFGLLWWTRRLVLPLPRPLLVAPRVGEPDPVLLGVQPNPGESDSRVDARVGEPRGVRPYRPGDRRHWVHWPATAHTGSLMVREMEGPASQPVVIEAVLPADPDAADRVAERVMGSVSHLLRQGHTVQLGTTEPEGRRSAPVADLAEAGRRLARAVPEVRR